MVETEPTQKPTRIENSMPTSTPQISNTEWILSISLLALCDLIMFGLDFTGFGEIFDPFIDGFIAMAYPLYLHLRGQSMNNNKRIAGVVATLLTGWLSDGILDFWWVDGLYNWSIYRAEQELAKVPGVNVVQKIPGKQLVGAKNVGGVPSLPAKSDSSKAKSEPQKGVPMKTAGHEETKYTTKASNPTNDPLRKESEPVTTERNRIERPTLAREDQTVDSVRRPDWMRDKSVDEVKKDPDGYLRQIDQKQRLKDVENKEKTKLARESVGYTDEDERKFERHQVDERNKAA